MNELIFILHVILITGSSLIALLIGPHALIASVCLQVVLANLFVIKQMSLFGMNVTCSDAFIVGGIFGLNLIQEFFGKQLARKTIGISFFIVMFYLVMSQLHLWYTPNNFDTMHQSFENILGLMPRITIASITVYLFVQLIDTQLYGFLKKLTSGRYAMLRSITSLTCSQLIDTILFSFLGLYGIVGSVWNIIIVSFTIKIIVILLTTPFTQCAHLLMRNKKS